LRHTAMFTSLSYFVRNTHYATYSVEIYSRFHWYTKCKNPPRNTGVMVKNKMARFCGSWCILYYRVYESYDLFTFILVVDMLTMFTSIVLITSG